MNGRANALQIQQIKLLLSEKNIISSIYISFMTFIYVFCFTNISHPPFAISHVLLLFYIIFFSFTIHLIYLPRFPLLFNFYYLFHHYLKIFISSLNFHHYVPFSHSFFSFSVSISLTPRFAFISITSFQVIGLLPHSVRLPFPSPIHI